MDLKAAKALGLTRSRSACDMSAHAARADIGNTTLTRFEQRALIKMFGGGSLRNEDPAVVARLRTRSSVDGNNALAMPGLFVLTPAMRRQRAESRIAS